MKKILLDVDTGVDDSIALLYALFHPEVEIVGITVGCGNVDAFQAAQNTLQILDLAKAGDIPVVIGANCPLSGVPQEGVPLIHGDNGVGNVELPPTVRKVVSGISAEDFIYKKVLEYQGDLTIVTLGRLTNMALTLKKYPDMVSSKVKVVTMGGTLYVQGNVSPVAEANIYGDPEACDILFYSGLDILVVGLDVTEKTRLTRARIQRVCEYCSQDSKEALHYIEQALTHYMKGNRILSHCIDDCPVHDPLAMVAAVAPSIVKTRKMKARVECGGTYCKGMIVTDLREKAFDAQYVEFAVEVNAESALRELFSVFLPCN